MSAFDYSVSVFGKPMPNPQRRTPSLACEGHCEIHIPSIKNIRSYFTQMRNLYAKCQPKCCLSLVV